MPNINVSTLSVYPLGIDNLTPWADGSGVNANLSATRINRIEAALYQAQKHTQQVVQVVSNPEDRRRALITANKVTIAPAAVISLSFLISASLLSFMGGQPFRSGNLILADIYDKEGVTALFTDVSLADPGALTVFGRTLDYQNGTLCPAGTYQFKVTILARG